MSDNGTLQVAIDEAMKVLGPGWTSEVCQGESGPFARLKSSDGKYLTFAYSKVNPEERRIVALTKLSLSELALLAELIK